MRTVLFQISSHWDREWYLPFQGFRYELVKMMDGVLDALEKNIIPEFVLDGQTIVLEDYLEIRPENRGRLEKQIRNNRLQIGPWYVMPDEFSVSGESLVENFLVGKNVSESFDGSPWRFGYVNDVFGHVAQFPQILNGFGIEGVYLGRGVPTRYPNDTHFLWIAPDGSVCYAYKDNYAEFRRNFCESEKPETVFLEKLQGTESDPPVLLNDTDDHAMIDGVTVRLLKLLKQHGCKILGGFDLLAEIMRPKQKMLPQIKGELASCAYLPTDLRVVTNSISSYYPIKQQNDKTETRLYMETAPLLVMAEMQNLMTDKRAFFQLARKYLLKNQPHDSVCGCSVDAVHRNMPYRYAQAEEIADSIRYDFTEKLKNRRRPGELTVSVLNTDLHPYTGILTLTIDFPQNWETVFSDNTGYQKINLFSIQDQSGNPVEYQVIDIQNGYELYHKQHTTLVNRYTVAISGSLLPFGVTSYTILPKQFRSDTPPQSPTGIPLAQNAYLRLEITADGTLNITDLETGKSYRNLLWFADDADSGNGWFHGEAGVGAACISSIGGTTTVEEISGGPLVWSFRVKKRMNIPEAINWEQGRRTETETALEICSVITLRREDRYISVETTVHNTASAHRLRLMLPTQTKGTDYFSSQAFGFVDRKRGSTTEGYNGREREYIEKNTGGIIGIDGAVAFVGGDGFHEGGVYPDGTVSVTMFRSIEKNFHEPRSIDAKLIGTMTFRYAIAFGMQRAELYHVRFLLQAGFQSLCTEPLTAVNDSWLRLSDRKLIVSTVKPAENGNGWIVRVFNPLNEIILAELTAKSDIRLELCNLSEQCESGKSGDGNLSLQVEPFKIVTVCLRKNDKSG